MNADDTPERKAAAEPVRVTAAKCLRCGKPVQPRTRPFCSQRCAEIDLGNWISGSYRVGTDEEGAGTGDEDPA
jgi:endogenous inhibitor of DNA gyrase (YacG/DUF329 family)